MKVRIGFDAKRIYDNTTGLGSYGRSLMQNLMRWYPQYDYRLFVHQNYLKHSHFKYREFVENTHTSNHYFPSIWRSSDIIKDIEQGQIDVFHGISNELPLSMPANTKSIVTIHDIIFHKYPDDFSLLDRKIYQYKTKKACELAHAVVAVSENTRQDLIGEFQIPAEKIFVIPPTWGREFEYNYSNWFRELLKKKYAIPHDYVLFVGSTSQRKNLKVILDALNYPENAEIPLVVVSHDSASLRELESYIGGTEIKKRVFFLKDVPWYELPGIYSMAKCVAYPSYYEGFGLPIIEGLKMRVPVIAADTSSLREAGGNSLMYLKPDDVDAWADAINQVVLNRATAHEIVQGGLEYIQRFIPQAMASTMIDLYAWVHAN